MHVIKPGSELVATVREFLTVGFSRVKRPTDKTALSVATIWATTCTVSPNSVTLNGTSTQDAKVTVTTTAQGLLPPGPNSGPPASGGFAFQDWWVVLLMLMAWLALVFRKRRRVTLLAGAALLAAMAMGCGGGAGGGGGSSTSPGTPAGTYTLTVTGTSGNLSHQATLTLNVQ